MRLLRQQLLELIEQFIETQLEDSSLATILASEDVLRRDWDSDAEDEAWADL
jgi:hypothetical protein